MEKLKVSRYHLKIRKCRPQGKNLRFVFISDQHNAVYGPENREMLELVRREHPDAVLIGEMLMRAPDRQEALKSLIREGTGR